jgi:hypothetical protein
VAEKMPEKVKELHERMLKWRQDVGAKLPTKNTDQKAAEAAGKKKGKGKKKKAAEDE